MRCEQARLELWPRPGPRATSVGGAEALAHYADCPACQWFFQVQAQLGARLGRLGSAAAPPQLRARILATLEREATAVTVRRRAGWMAGAGTALLAAAAIVLLVGRGPEPATLASPLVAHVQGVLEDTQGITSSDIAEIERWFVESMGHPVVVPDIGDAYLLGGRVVALNGTQAAVVVYLYQGRPLTYFALPTDDLLGVTLRGDEVMATSVEGYEVALWTESGKARAVVARMSRAAVVDVAKECRDKALIRVS